MILREHVDFADLALEREPATDRIVFAPGPLRAMCEANGMDATAILADEDLSCWLVGEWYYEHIAPGGIPDKVMELAMVDLVRGAELGDGHTH